MENEARLAARAEVAELIKKARAAMAEFETYSQEKTDEIVRAIGKYVYDNAEYLAKRAVEESRMGVYEDKVAKCHGKSKLIWNSMKGKKSIGIIDEDPVTGIIRVAKPKGVVCSVTPVTNPVVTPMCNAMFAFKGHNAVIVAPHPTVKKLNWELVESLREVLRGLGAPVDLLQTVAEPTLDMSAEMMAQSDQVVATGGSGMVKAAYSSGTPAHGVGPGNVQVIVDRGVDLDETAKKIIAGRIFDNGIICSGEQCVFFPRELFDEGVAAFKANGAYYIDDPEEVAKFAEAIFPNGGPISRKVVGQSVQKVAEVAGVAVPEGTRMILLKAREISKAEPLCREKMCPVMITWPYDTFEDAVELAQTDLDIEGRGHTTAVHSNDLEHVKYAGEKLTISRLIVNQTSSTGAGGSLFNGFNPTTTLGCGSWGNNSLSENLTWTHLINVSQIGLNMAGRPVPTDEEIWAE